jgi:RimJ/RimL family protein N-acetyltransferase
MFEEANVYLRALEVSDHEKTYEWRKDPEYKKGVLSTKRFISVETERKWIEKAIESHERGENIRLGVVLKKTEELIGLVYLTEVDHVNKRARSGWWIGNPDERGSGYATEACILLLRYAFEELSLQRVEARLLVENDASMRLAENVGYKKEGVLRSFVFKNNRKNDVAVYSIMRNEYIEVHK